MIVEVNEENILRYGLVQLTGNSTEELLKAAKEAANAGYTLTCKIPDNNEVHLNLFEAAGSVPSDPDFGHQDSPLMDREAQEEHGRVIGVVIESHIIEED